MKTALAACLLTGSLVALGIAPAHADAPAVAVETTSATPDALVLDVDGSGFTGVTNPGDDGVYVGLAPAGGLPATDSQDDQDAFAAAAWVPAAQMGDGTFEVTLSADPADLDSDEEYAIYTWQAHTHSNITQDTETAVAIDWEALASPSTTHARVTRNPSPASPGTLKVSVTGDAGPAAGTVLVVLTQGSTRKKVTEQVLAGRATVTIPRLARGAWKTVATYQPRDTYASSRDRLTIQVD